MGILRVENIIATYFNQNPDKDRLTSETIYKIKQLLETEFKKKDMLIWVDYTRGTLLSTLQNNADIFQEEGETIILKDRQQFDEDFERYFNAKLEREIKPTYLQLVEVFKEPIK